MIYLDTSVAIAHLLAEERQPPVSLWSERLVSSRLLEYEVWTRIHERRLTRSHSEAVHALLEGIAFLEMLPAILARALDPFSSPVRTLDALHLASIDFLRARGHRVALASYDDRLLATARELGVASVPL